MPDGFLLALEGGGSRSQAALMDFEGQVIRVAESADVNTYFISLQEAHASVLAAVSGVLQDANVGGERVSHFAVSLVDAQTGPELLGEIVPQARYHYYDERDVLFARAGIYQPHGVAVVAATGATAWSVRADDGRQAVFGGWGALLGDEGSAYAVGWMGLRAAARAYEGREEARTDLVAALCQQLGLSHDTFREDLTQLVYKKPMSRAEIAALAVVVTRLAASGDVIARRIVDQAADDLTGLMLHAARRLFGRDEAFPVAVGGGLFNAGEMILAPVRDGLAKEFPKARLVLGQEAPAVALGRLALHDIAHERRHNAD
jgi:N-acetylglucosamine kinase-like BadF-type ATPase